MRAIALTLALLACKGQARRVQPPFQHSDRSLGQAFTGLAHISGGHQLKRGLSPETHSESPSKAERAFTARSAVARMQGGAVAEKTETVAEETENPLLANSGLPRFNSIEVVNVDPAVEKLLAKLREDFDQFEGELKDEKASPSYETVVEAQEKMQFPLGYSWGIVGHLNGVKNSEALREVYQAAQPKVVQTSLAISQSRPVYDALAKLEGDELSGSQRRVVDSALRSMRLAGVELTGEDKERFNEIQLKLSELGTKFQNHVLDSTGAFELILTDKAEVDGLPPSILAAAAQSYVQAKPNQTEATAEDGPWRLSLDIPSYLPAMQYLKSSKIRERLYRAYIARASKDEADNRPLIDEILKLRQEASKILGFSNYAEQSLASKMAPDVAAVEKLTADLFEKARPAAERELAELREFAKSKGHDEELKLWDVTFWGQRLKEERYSFDEEALRPYFSLPKVLDGMFGIARKLFGVTVSRDDSAAERWHPDVMFFRMNDEATGEEIASFFLDPYSRPAEKRGGAWMAPAIGRSKALGTKPVAYLTCNGSPPVGDQPSLMTFQEVETLFHEFGHGLQHMLTHVDEGDAAGINNVEWDAVELPSQFMENWLYHKPTVDSFAKHWKTGEPLPADTLEKIKGARTFQAGMMMLRQLQFQTVDMELHKQDIEASGKGPFEVYRGLAQEYAVIPPLEEDYFLCSFFHIFASSGYAAGYYSYKWAEVLSADAFAAFEEAGLEDDEALASTGRRFRETVLGRGGSQDPAEVYRDFRGKDATADALLRHNGLL